MIDENIPDPIWHRNISFVKSGLRIIACGFLVTGGLVGAGGFLFVAELLGIYEELV